MKQNVNFLTELSNFIFTSKYARYNQIMSRRETWDECVSRVEKMHVDKFKKILTSTADIEQIKEVFDLVRNKMAVPSMRSMQFGGKAILQHNAKIYNCATRHVDSIRAFAEIFYLLLCGVGVGLGVSKQIIDRLPPLVDATDKTGTIITYPIQDTIEGWADSIEALLSCYVRNTAFSGRKIVFDYSRIRPEGAPLRTSGGKAPGYKGLKAMHKKIKALLDHIIEVNHQTKLKPVNVYDIICHSADAVLSGGIRRSALSAIFHMDDDEMLNAKIDFTVTKSIHFQKNEKTNKWEGIVYVDGKYGGIKNHKYEVVLDDYEYKKLKDKKLISWLHIEPQRARANNSVLLIRSTVTIEDFLKINELTRQYGEPGFVFGNHLLQLFNPCFDRNTRIATDKGLIKIGDLYESQQKIKVTTDNRVGKFDAYFDDKLGTTMKQATQVALTQQNAAIFELITTHGNSIKVTANHEFITPTGRKQLQQLQIGDNILLQSGEGVFGSSGTYEEGLMTGMITGDGSISNKRAELGIWEDDFESLDSIQQALYKSVESLDIDKTEIFREGYRGFNNKDHKIIGSSRLYKKFVDLGLADPRDMKSHVPEYIWRGSRDMVRGYLQGLIFADGSVNLKCETKGSVSTLSIEISQSNKSLLQEVQILLNNFGVVSRLYKLHDIQLYEMPDGKGSTKLYPCKAAYRLSINRPNSIKLLSTIGLFGRKHEKLKQLLDIRGYSCRKPEKYLTTVKSIEYSHNDDVFCFNQKETNSTIANGLAVGQCFEANFIPMTEDGVFGCQFCNLTSVNGAKIKTKQDFFEAVRGATIIGTLQAAYTDFKYLSTASKIITESEALLGVSITGLMDNPQILLDPDIQKEAAEYAVAVNIEWAAKLGIKPAARITVIKPEGSSSLVLESASGIHPHHARRYFRRVQCNKHDPVYKLFKHTNPHVCEESVWSANGTDDVMIFPLTVPDIAMIKSDLSAIKHLEIIKSTQQNWVLPGTTSVNKKPITHNVSCTVLVDDAEWDPVFRYVFDNRDFFGAVSFLPKCGDKIYKQAPNEAITTPEDEQKWADIVSKYTAVNYNKLMEDEDNTTLVETAGCAGGRCEVV